MNCSTWIIWQLWARSADSRSYSAITQSFEEILPHRQDADSDRNPTSIVTRRVFDEIPRDSTRFHLNLTTRTILTTGRSWRQNTISIPPLPISQMTPPTSSSSTTIILNKSEDWEQWLWQLRTLVDQRILGPRWPRWCSTSTRSTTRTSLSRSHRFQWECNLVCAALDESTESVREQQTILRPGHEVFPKTGRSSSTDTHPDHVYSINSEEATTWPFLDS